MTRKPTKPLDPVGFDAPAIHAVLVREPKEVVFQGGDPAICTMLVRLAADCTDARFEQALVGGLVARARRANGRVYLIAMPWDHPAESLLDTMFDVILRMPQPTEIWFPLPARGDGGASGAPAEIAVTNRRRAN